ncbi:hypothetical protein [Roseitalea porphyridii]|uniref:Uncharacterized protein n=1 Tax=Roseitalea porphyridii TaxID=1852022 RepID=A0A4P6UYL3_9HYPH|nr:hypothetical protein [Roseitalea porphyridii]QBK30141.1 hypothetical protein E0E05_05730 [Roseitalea porphyridii]
MIRFLFFIWLAAMTGWVGFAIGYSGGSQWAIFGCFLLIVWFVRQAFPDKNRGKFRRAFMVELHAQRQAEKDAFEAEVNRRAQELLRQKG